MDTKHAGADQPFKSNAPENEQKQGKEGLSQGLGCDAIPLPAEGEIRPVSRLSTKSENDCFELLNHLFNDLAEGIDTATAHILANTIATRFRRVEARLAALEENHIPDAGGMVEDEEVLHSEHGKTNRVLAWLGNIKEELTDQIESGIDNHTARDHAVGKLNGIIQAISIVHEVFCVTDVRHSDEELPDELKQVFDGCEPASQVAADIARTTPAPEVRPKQWYKWKPEYIAEKEIDQAEPMRYEFEIIQPYKIDHGKQGWDINYGNGEESNWSQELIINNATLILDPDWPVEVGDRFEAGGTYNHIWKVVGLSNDGSGCRIINLANTLTSDHWTSFKDLRAMRRLPNVKWLETEDQKIARDVAKISAEHEAIRKQAKAAGDSIMNMKPTTEESSAVQDGEAREKALLRRQVEAMGRWDGENWTDTAFLDIRLTALIPTDSDFELDPDDVELQSLDEMTDYLWSLGVRSSWREEASK